MNYNPHLVCSMGRPYSSIFKNVLYLIMNFLVFKGGAAAFSNTSEVFEESQNTDDISVNKW